MIVNDINVTVNGLSDITPHEVENYIAYIEGQTNEKLDRLSITGADDGRVTLGYERRQPKFERIRRIAGTTQSRQKSMSVSSTDSTEIRIAGIARDSIVDGEGIRLTVFTQGCPRRCPGCHNPDTQPTDGGRVTTVGAVLQDLDANPLLTGLTLSGGEPFLQPAALIPLARAAHERGLDVWSYTGYTLEELRAQKNPAVDALLDELDVLVDGDYREEERDLTLHFRGSRNQRVIDLAATRATGQLTLRYTEE